MAHGENLNLAQVLSIAKRLKRQTVASKLGMTVEKKIKGRKRHIAVDVLGFLIAVVVHSSAAMGCGAYFWLAEQVSTTQQGLRTFTTKKWNWRQSYDSQFV